MKNLKVCLLLCVLTAFAFCAVAQTAFAIPADPIGYNIDYGVTVAADPINYNIDYGLTVSADPINYDLDYGVVNM